MNRIQNVVRGIKYIGLQLSAILLFSFQMSAQGDAGAIIGVWETEDKDARMEVFQSGDTYSANLLWGAKIVEEDGKTSKKDVKNPDEKLRSRDVVGITFLKGLTYEDEKYSNGRIYNSANGKTYKCHVKLKKGRLHLRGYLGVPALGKTTKWDRVINNTTEEKTAKKQ